MPNPKMARENANEIAEREASDAARDAALDRICPKCFTDHSRGSCEAIGFASFRVRWEIDVDAGSPEEAAREALRIQRDPNSIATCFDVRENGEHIGSEACTWQIDLQEIDEIEAGRALEQCNGGCLARPGEQWIYTGMAYGGDDQSYHGEGRCYCQFCGADGDA